MGLRFISKFPLPLYLFTLLLYLGSAKPAQALEEGDCFNNSTVVITGSITDSSGISDIDVTVDGSPPSAFNIDNGNWTATFAGLSDGPHTLLVTGTDACGSGNTATTDPLGFKVDTVPPFVAIISPIDGTLLCTGSIVMSGSYENGDTICEERLDFWPWQPCGTGFPPIPDGPHTIYIRVTDSCGNSDTDSVSFTVDSMEPVVNIMSPVSGECISTSVVVVDGSVFETGSGVYEITVQAGAYTATGTSFPIILNIPVDGIYDITAQAVDYCGNIGPLDTVANIRVDTSLPTVSIISPTYGACLNSTTVVVSGTAEDGTGSGIAAVLVNSQTASGTYSWSITLTSNQYGEPIEIGSRNTADIALEVFVSESYAYVADRLSGLAIIDVSDPANPGAPVYRDTSGWSGGVYVTGGYAYVGDGPSGLAIIDVSDPANPGTPVYRDTSGESGGVYVTGGYAYVADRLSGLAIIDVSDPANPGTPVYRDTSGDSWEVYVTGGYAYVADRDSGLAIIDVSDPENPGAPVYRDTSGWSNGVYVTGGYAYVADGDSGLAIIDVRDPENPGAPVYRDISGWSRGVYVTGGYAYVADQISGLAIIDVSDPTNPGTPVYRDTSGWSPGVHVTGGNAYVADGDSGFRVIDVSSFNYPVFSAVAIDNCGNVSDPATVNVTIDTTANVSITSPGNGVTISAGDVLVSGTADTDITTVTVTSDQGHSESSAVDGAGNWAVALTGVVAPSMVITAEGMDNCGNTGSDSVTVSVEPVTSICSISSVGPTTGCPGDSVTITGTSFGITVGSVSFDGITANITFWSDTSVIVEAPGGDYSDVTVTTTASDSCSLGGSYSYDNIANVSITSPVDGETVITGDVPVTGTADTDITTAIVMSNQGHVETSGVDPGGNWSVVLTGVNVPSIFIAAVGTDDCGNVGSDSVMVPVVPPLCNISSVGPTTGCPGDAIAIAGTNFGETTGSVSFDATSAAVISWGDTSIIVEAPGGDYSNVTVTPMAGVPCSLGGTYSYENEPPTGLAAAPAGGSYCVTPVTVSLSASDGTIYYTLDDSEPTTGSSVYTVPIEISVDTTLKFMAVDACGNQTETVTEVYDIDTETTITITSPVDGVTIVAGDVPVTGTSDTDITVVIVISDQGHIESSGVDPGGNWSVVLSGVTVSSIFIAAVGTDGCGNVGSDSVTVPVIPPCNISSVGPTTGCPGDAIAIAGTNFGETTGSVSFDATSAAVISWGDTSIIVEAPGGDYSNVTVTPMAGVPCSLGGTYSYENEPPTGLAAAPAGGSYCVTPVTVSLSASDGTIYYTLDDSEPTTGSPVYTGSFDIGIDTTLKFMAVDACGNQSAIVIEVYDIDTEAVVSITYPVDGETVIAGDVPVTGTADTDITTVIVISDQGHVESSGVDAGGNWSVVLSGVTVSSIFIDAQGTDDCGNIGSDSVTVPVSYAVCVWFVDDDAMGAGTGISWADAFTVIQDAVNTSTSGETICVAEGTYTNTPTSTISVLTMKAGIEIYGGFTGTEIDLSERGDPAAHPTILDGENTSYHVVVGSSNARLDGFTVAGGAATGTSFYDSGGGMSNNNVTGLKVANCTFSSNSALVGGGMLNYNSSPTITNCTFIGNSADWYGGGMFNDQSSPTITNCTFADNSADLYGGGMFNWLNSSPMIANCTFSGNSAFDSGGGMYNDQSSPTITNCIMWGDFPDEIYDDFSIPTVTYSDIQGGYLGLGNISLNPWFVSGPNGNYYLSQIAAGQFFQSPCVNAGSDTAANLGMDDKTTSTNGDLDTGIVDMGYHYEP